MLPLYGGETPAPRFAILRLRPAALDVHGHAIGVRQDVFFDGHGHALQRMAHEELIRDLDGERLDQAARERRRQRLDLKRHGMIIDGM